MSTLDKSKLSDSYRMDETKAVEDLLTFVE